MSTSAKTKMVRVRCLKAVVGAYPCPATEADHISTDLVENDQGQLVTVRKPYKKFRLLQGYRKFATAADVADDAARVARGERSWMSFDGQHIEVTADEGYLPESYIRDNRLVESGLVEIIDEHKSPRRTAA